MKSNKALKIIISLLLSVVTLCSLSVSAVAAIKEETTVQPRWTSIFTMDVVMAFEGNEGTAVGTARKQSTASNIVGALYLYKWNGSSYEYMDDVWGSKTVGTLSLSIDFDAEVGVQYKAVFVVVAYTDGVGEEETITCYRTCK